MHYSSRFRAGGGSSPRNNPKATLSAPGYAVSLDALILDLDGTLVKLPVDWPTFEKYVETLIGRRMMFLEFVAKYFATPMFWRVHEFLERLELEACNNMVVYDDTREFLDSVLSNARFLAVVTMQGSKPCLKIVERLGLVDRVFLCVTREVAPTRYQQLSIALELLNTDPSKTVFVGDKVIDGFAAHRCGIRGIVVMRGLATPRISESDDIIEDLKSLGIHVVRNLREAISILKSL